MLIFLLLSCSDVTTVPKNENVKKEQYREQNTKQNPKRQNRPPPQRRKQNVHGQLQKRAFAVEPSFQLLQPVKQEQKSVILISLDTLSAQRMEIYGGRARTPNLKKLAENGVVFEQAISHFPETAPSHWSIMTGVLPEVHGNVPHYGGSIYTGPTLAELSQKSEYATAAFIGGATITNKASGLSRGFQIYDDQFPLNNEDLSRKGSEVLQRSLTWIQQQKREKQDFFAFVHFFDAHFPYTPKKNLYNPDYRGNIDGTDKKLEVYRSGKQQPSKEDLEQVIALYDSEITELDQLIAPLLELADTDTIVVVLSDHGESFSHNYYFNHHHALWDEVIHVPLVICGGDISPKRVENQVGLIDVAPTILDLAGLSKDKRMQGKSLMSSIYGTDKEEQVVYSITDPWRNRRQISVRKNNFHVIQSDNQTLRYSLKSDPLELYGDTAVPIDIEKEKDIYQDQILSLKAHQQKAGEQRKIPKEECERLQKLGYTTCQK